MRKSRLNSELTNQMVKFSVQVSCKPRTAINNLAKKHWNVMVVVKSGCYTQRKSANKKL